MKIFYPNKESVDVDHNGKTARFSGDIGVGGFRAFASSMRWMLPVRDVPVSLFQGGSLLSGLGSGIRSFASLFGEFKTKE